jgi:hypothetical protein
MMMVNVAQYQKGACGVVDSDTLAGLASHLMSPSTGARGQDTAQKSRGKIRQEALGKHHSQAGRTSHGSRVQMKKTESWRIVIIWSAQRPFHHFS